MWLKALLLLSCLALILGAAVPEEQEVAAPVVHFVNDVEMAKFLSENPNAVKLDRSVSPLTNKNGRAEYDLYRLSWTLGSRQTSDSRVYNTVSDLMFFDDAVNAKLVVMYPQASQAGLGKIVTYVSISIDQSSPLGDAWVSEGGIGQRNIEIYIVGYNTYFWKWDVSIYGKD